MIKFDNKTPATVLLNLISLQKFGYLPFVYQYLFEYLFFFIQILPALQSFCIFAAIGIISVFILTITLFVALLALDARRQQSRRDACLCCITLSDNWEAMECSKKSYLQLFIEKYYGPAILSIPGKVIAFFTYCLHLCCSFFAKKVEFFGQLFPQKNSIIDF